MNSICIGCCIKSSELILIRFLCMRWDTAVFGIHEIAEYPEEYSIRQCFVACIHFGFLQNVRACSAILVYYGCIEYILADMTDNVIIIAVQILCVDRAVLSDNIPGLIWFTAKRKMDKVQGFHRLADCLRRFVFTCTSLSSSCDCPGINRIHYIQFLIKSSRSSKILVLKIVKSSRECSPCLDISIDCHEIVSLLFPFSGRKITGSERKVHSRR